METEKPKAISITMAAVEAIQQLYRAPKKEKAALFGEVAEALSMPFGTKNDGIHWRLKVGDTQYNVWPTTEKMHIDSLEGKKRKTKEKIEGLPFIITRLLQADLN